MPVDWSTGKETKELPKLPWAMYRPEPMAFENPFSSWDRERRTPKPKFWDKREEELGALLPPYNARRNRAWVEGRARQAPWPDFEAARALLPDPFWTGHATSIACYWKVWEIAFKNFRSATEQNGFVSDFAATMFNDCTFLWDSVFITLFGRYGSRAWDFQRTLDNFYAKQHPDGFICRQIREADGQDTFERFDPVSTGPNVFAWSEWEYFLNFGDRERLAAIFPAVVAYTRWMAKWHTWPNGAHWTSGWGCGMDNQPRVPPHTDLRLEHAHVTWVDANFQQLLSNRLLLRMAEVLGRTEEVQDLAAEAEQLVAFANSELWDEATGFYHDLWRDQTRNSAVKSIGAYWALIAEAVPESRIARFVAHLEDSRAFNRPHRVPSLSADHPAYNPEGGYWNGAVWAPTTYMLLRGLTRVGRDALAHEIALNHLHNVVLGFEKTGTLWENYAPELEGHGNNGKDFVGWTGVPPVTVLFEYAFGLRPDVPSGKLLWDIRLTEEHGVKRYPFGKSGLLDLSCAARPSVESEPAVEVRSSIPVELTLRWAGGERTLKLAAT
jgi:hypothetical protein